MIDQPANRYAEKYAGKVSQEFAARLERLAPDETIRAIVLPAISSRHGAKRDHTNDAQRAAAIAETETAIQGLFCAIDKQFTETTGARISRRPNALGYVVVETTQAGIAKLTHLEGVRAILEDQPVFHIHSRQDERSNHF